MKKAIIVTDLGYGDAGKGSMVDFLARDAHSPLVVRHNGGPQAAHNVVTSDGRHHTFAQFGSASFVPGSRTHLSRFMLVNPFNLMAEAEHLVKLGELDILDRITIDRDALVITPWHIAANRIRELVRAGGRHGSCGQGIGETKFDSIHFPEFTLTVGDLTNPALVRRKLAWVQNLKQIQLQEILEDLPAVEQSQKELEVLESSELIDLVADYYRGFAATVTIVDGSALATVAEAADLTLFEGAQAVLLDEDYGFHPYTTWSVTTQANALTLLSEIDYRYPVKRLGLTRAYMVRHGAGPFVSEEHELSVQVPDYHNGNNDWQHGFRVGHLDFVALRYALAANGPVDELAITNLDRLTDSDGWSYVDGYQLPETHATSPYFTGVKNGIASGIRVGPQNQRDYQEAITKVLFETKPVFSGSIPTDQEQFLELIEEKLDTSVGYISAGMTANEKKRRHHNQPGQS